VETSGRQPKFPNLYFDNPMDLKTTPSVDDPTSVVAKILITAARTRIQVNRTAMRRNIITTIRIAKPKSFNF
jgi:hypothetical protein